MKEALERRSMAAMPPLEPSGAACVLPCASGRADELGKSGPAFLSRASNPSGFARSAMVACALACRTYERGARAPRPMVSGMRWPASIAISKTSLVRA